MTLLLTIVLISGHCTCGNKITIIGKHMFEVGNKVSNILNFIIIIELAIETR